MSRLQKLYTDSIMKGMMDQFGYKNVMQVPRINKITLNMGVGEAAADKKVLNNAIEDLTKIAGQKALMTMSRSQ